MAGGWISLAILMPASAIRSWVVEYAYRFCMNVPFPTKSPAGSSLIAFVVEPCDVSIIAAIVRLSELNLLVER